MLESCEIADCGLHTGLRILIPLKAVEHAEELIETY